MTDLASRSGSSAAKLPVHKEELPDVEAYRTVSWGAIAVLVGSFFTPLAFLSQVLWLAPLAVIVAAVLVLRHLAVNADRLTGQRLVWIGMAIAMLILGWAPARERTRFYRVLADARQVADQWAELVNHRDLQQAHQWHISSGERAGANTTLDTFYKESSDKQAALQKFVDAPAIKNWLQLDEAHSEYVGLARHNNAYSDAEEFVLQYRVTGKRKGKDVELPAYIVVVRRAIGPGKFDFRVENVIDFDPMTLDLN